MHQMKVWPWKTSFLNSLTSVRVFTRMVSDNPWCSLWVPSSQSWTSKITIIFSCLHIHDRTSLTKPVFQQQQNWNLVNFFKIGDNWPISGIFTGIVRTFCAVYKVWRWRSQVFTSWCGKIQTDFLFTKIVVFLMYREIYVYIFAIIQKSKQHTGVCIV